LLERSSLLFASLKTSKTLKTLNIPRRSFHQALWPQAFVVRALQLALRLHSPLLFERCSLPFASIALCCEGVQACRLPALKPLKILKPLTSLTAASTKHSGHKHLLLERCSLPFASIGGAPYGIGGIAPVGCWSAGCQGPRWA